jgi:DNA-nicking Smr family endonuclease
MDLPDDQMPEDVDAIPLEIDGVLDLHMFPPNQVKDLVRDYLEACLEAGILDVRIIHGKGIGVLRTIVFSILEQHPAVESFGHPNDSGSWGATVVRLKS